MIMSKLGETTEFVVALSGRARTDRKRRVNIDFHTCNQRAQKLPSLACASLGWCAGATSFDGPFQRSSLGSALATSEASSVGDWQPVDC